MSVLVTGAPGWLGTELVRNLDDTGQEVHCLTLVGEDTSELDQFDVIEHPGDVTKPETLNDAFKSGIDTVFHCAGIIHPPSITGANMFFDINAGGTKNVAEAAAEHGVEHFVYISSNAAQGFNDSSGELMTEKMPCQPESNYGQSKYEAEQHVKRIGGKESFDYTIVRPCWYYGPRQPERMTRLMEMIQGGNPLIFGDGSNLRSMTYVPNLAEALLAIMQQPEVSKGETYWIADERPYTTDYIYRTIARLLNCSEGLKPIYVPTPISRLLEIVDVTIGNLGLYEQNVHVAGEMSRDIACDPSKARRELDWEPPTDLTPGMRAGVDWAQREGEL